MRTRTFGFHKFHAVRSVDVVFKEFWIIPGGRYVEEVLVVMHNVSLTFSSRFLLSAFADSFVLCRI